MNNIELLAPAGSYEVFKAVTASGADAVYLGGNRFGARAYADNFSESEILSAIDEAHVYGKKIYLTVNTLFKEDELRELYGYLLPYYRQGLDAVIVQDIGAMAFIRREFPDIHIHTSTQMTIASSEGASLMKSLGAARVVAAREMSLVELKDIKESAGVELEAFVHGALCYCYSGQCLLSSMIGGRSGNRGRCAQPCRLPYEVCDKNFRKISSKGSFVLSPKDLCTIESVPALIEAGVDSFKIEGRMKKADYASTVVSVYREYIDKYLYDKDRIIKVDAQAKKRLLDAGNRSGFTDGYLTKRNGSDMITFSAPNHTRNDEKAADIQELKTGISGRLTLKKDIPAAFLVSYHGFSYEAAGDMVQAAVKQPLSRDKILSGINKTGGTPFAFNNIDIYYDDDIFMPVSSINALRREALDGLFDTICSSHRREAPDKNNEALSGNSFGSSICKTGINHFAVSVEERSQLFAALKYDFIDDIYIDSTCYTRSELDTLLANDVSLVKDHGKNAYFILPSVIRHDTACFYRNNIKLFSELHLSGLVTKSLDGIQLAIDLGIPFITDCGVYAWNSEAKSLLFKLGAGRDTVPLELNRKEISARNNQDSEVIIYGYFPLMTSAQCINANVSRANVSRANTSRANTSRCDKRMECLYLKDRFGKYFPVKNNCAECYNTIYNSLPAVLFNSIADLAKMGLNRARISFTIEDDVTTDNVLKVFDNLLRNPEFDISAVFPAGSYTNGHYKRGVE